MAPAGTNPKIEELRFKIKTDPKSRLFYPLAEELRKIGQFAEAEQVLRAGLTTHATYLSAWVVLGRVLREQQKYTEGVTALTRALELDRGNVVAARLLAETYLAMGEKVEAIKKYKLVHALLPGDEDIEAIIHRLQQELDLPAVAEAVPQPAPPAPPPPDRAVQPPAPRAETARVEPDTADVFDVTYSGLNREKKEAIAGGHAEPMPADHSQSPFEDPAADAGSDMGEPFPPPPLAPQRSPLQNPADDADLFEPASEIAPGFIQGRFDANVPPPPAGADDFAKTITMADLYANQGLIDEARDIYEDVLARDPDNALVRAKLEALEAPEASGPGPQASGEHPAPDDDIWARKPAEPSPEAAAQASGPRPQASGEHPAPDDVWAREPAEPSPEARGPWSEASPAEPSPEARGLGPEASSARPEALAGKVQKLQSWLSKVRRPGVGSV